MKTIFISVFEGIEGKNILRTPVVSTLLAEKDIRLVCFTKSWEKVDYYKKEFPHPRLIFEAVSNFEVKGAERFFRALRYYLIDTETTRLRARMIKEREGHFLKYFWKLALHRLLARPFVRRIVRLLDLFLLRPTTFKQYFEEYKPDLVLSAQLFEELEVHFIKEAKNRGIKTVCFINSWDKVTARSALRVLADKFIVFNNIVKEELMANDDVPAENIFVSGIPQYDQFFDPSSLESLAKDFGKGPITYLNNKEFLAFNNLSPAQPFILYAPMGVEYSNSDWEIIDLLQKNIQEKVFGGVSLFVRFPPNDFANQEEIRKRPWLRFYLPGRRFSKKRGTDWDMDFKDLALLSDTLRHASLVICYASSISIDAAVFDKPVVNLDFEVKPGQLMIKSPTRFFDMSHYKKALATGGIRLVHSKEELSDWVCKYLSDPSLDRGGRKRLLEEQCLLTDGNSGERAATRIISFLLPRPKV